MPVKDAMGQVGGFHDVGDADTVESLDAEQCAGGLNDALAVFGGFFAAYSHRVPPPITSKMSLLPSFLVSQVTLAMCTAL
jgi:hypothetical protein